MDKLLDHIDHLEKQILELYILDLKTNGYTVIPSILNSEEIIEAKQLFFKWKNDCPDLDKFHSDINPHGIYKFHEIGHQEHAWFIRTRPKVIDVFKKLWAADDLTVSFDGSCYIPENCTKKDKLWTHTDQAPINCEKRCYQGFVSLTKNKERTLIVYKKSHDLHAEYFKEKNITDSKNWHLIDKTYLDTIAHNKVKVQTNPGDLVLWDSRTFHQNCYGNPLCEERLIQYVCYLPKNNSANTDTIQKKRAKYFEERRTTSHWPYPLKVNSLQPQTYGDKSRLIDYSLLKKSDLSKYMETIKTLL